MTTPATNYTASGAAFTTGMVDGDQFDTTHVSALVNAVDLHTHLSGRSLPVGRIGISGADIASASALTLGTDGNVFHVTGTTTITSISTRADGELIVLIFDGALTFTHNGTTLILLNGTNVTTQAGDVFFLLSEGGGNYREIARLRPTGGGISGLGNWKALYTNGSGVISELALGTSGKDLRANGASSAPTFNTIAPTELVGNTWKTYYGDGSGVVTELALGTSGYVLTSNGASAAPSWQDGSSGMITPVMVTPWSLNSIGTLLASGDGVTPGNNSLDMIAGGNVPASNRAIFVPFQINETSVTVLKMFLYNGTAVSGNVDIGIYNESYTRIVSSGSTAQSGTSAIQEFDIADTALARGRYYMALVLDNTLGKFYGWNSLATILKGAGVFQESSAFPLPATTTPAALGTYILPYFGFSLRTLVA